MALMKVTLSGPDRPATFSARAHNWMSWRFGEDINGLRAAGKEHPARRRNGISHVLPAVETLPVIAILRLPWRALVPQQDDTGVTGCIARIAADLPRKRMRDINKKLDCMLTAMGGKPFDPAETTADGRDWERCRVRCRACE